ncbi:hypothetical protein ISG33_00070 [Glaciecola sp. MH2013]|uniref:hypothetical protein n=1 Tax=Glaciecola sp. MH2013 TaxID=2785524 RepID=UPI00189FDB94|nr:hypothetical protein [Glaciecola sp. MH2013]MBF7071791.1 hypothetical protein [Glaciecola sp. MH2013]
MSKQKKQLLKFCLISWTSIASFSSIGQPQVLSERLLACAEETDSLQRLVCYDSLATEAKKTRIDKQVQNKPSMPPQASTPPQVEDETADFGKPPVSIKESYLEDGELVSSIKSSAVAANKRFRITLENGQLWEVLDSGKPGLPRVNDEIIIRSGAFGSFYMRKSGVNRSFKVKRILN